MEIFRTGAGTGVLVAIFTSPTVHAETVKNQSRKHTGLYKYS